MAMRKKITKSQSEFLLWVTEAKRDEMDSMDRKLIFLALRWGDYFDDGKRQELMNRTRDTYLKEYVKERK